jgi:hypothetical protein
VKPAKSFQIQVRRLQIGPLFCTAAFGCTPFPRHFHHTRGCSLSVIFVIVVSLHHRFAGRSTRAPHEAFRALVVILEPKTLTWLSASAIGGGHQLRLCIQNRLFEKPFRSRSSHSAFVVALVHRPLTHCGNAWNSEPPAPISDKTNAAVAVWI